ncbi:hypothetical protein MSAN_00913300 [Mycena sanguinolenta]|uniref:Uncharacterized protein n=1 Tax=Mycena sanguinolenta TaxID=230812 RepID=A0A8H6YXL2_9AGAR|nr:hypothetical protein MSAN_00913300 [Mycena sanguinolenta]
MEATESPDVVSRYYGRATCKHGCKASVLRRSGKPSRNFSISSAPSIATSTFVPPQLTYHVLLAPQNPFFALQHTQPAPLKSFSIHGSERDLDSREVFGRQASSSSTISVVFSQPSRQFFFLAVVSSVVFFVSQPSLLLLTKSLKCSRNFSPFRAKSTRLNLIEELATCDIFCGLPRDAK